MEGATHFVEVWKKKSDVKEKYSKPLPISEIQSRLAITSKMKKYKTIAVWQIKPKPEIK